MLLQDAKGLVAEFQYARQFWYIACASSQLGNAPRPVRVLDLDLAVYRDGRGGVGALEDRCCHRGVKLSLGRVTDGHLACGYHGWQYDASGRCAHIPSLCAAQDIPGGARVRAFPCAEQDGYVWVWTGEGSPNPAAPPPIPGFSDSGWRQGVSIAACGATMLLENQIDGAHPYFAHEGTHPSYFFTRLRGMKENEFELRTTEAGVVTFYPPVASADEPIPADCRSLTAFEAPNRIHVRQRLLLTEDFFIVLHVVPTGPSSCRMEWLQRDLKASGVEWVPEETTIIRQDRLLLESAQAAYDADGGAFERSVPIDVATFALRKAVHACTLPDWRAELAKLPRRRIVRART